MKIALISHLFPTELHPFSGKFIQDQLTILNDDADLEADLLVPTPYTIPFTQRRKKNHSPLLADTDSKRLRYVSFPRKKLSKIISASLSNSISRYLKDKSYDLIHVHWLYPDALCIPTLKKMGLKTVLTIHGSDWYQSKSNRALKTLFNKVLQDADQVLFSGPKLKEDVESHFSFLPDKTDLIYNLVDESIYNVPSGDEKKNAKQHLGWDKEKTHCLTVGNIRHEKGIDLLLEAIHTESNLKDTHFHIVGAPGPEDYLEGIQSLIAANKFKNITIHGPVLPDRLINYYRASDFFVQPSRREGFSVAILEAMACGLPVVCTDVGGNNLLIDDKTGFMAETSSPEDIRDQILKMNNCHDTYDSRNIHKKIISEYGRKAFKKRLLDTYDEALRNNSV